MHRFMMTGLLLLALTAPAQAQEWKLLVSVKGTAVFADTMPEGPMDAREVTTLTVLVPAQRGMDNEFNYFTVDCGAKTIEDSIGTAFLGAVKVANIASATNGQMQSYDPDGLFGIIADYACTGARVSGDSNTLTSDAGAVAYGQKIAQ